MKKRVRYETWGARGAAKDVDLGSFCYCDPEAYQEPAGAVVASIERRLGLVACGQTPQGTELRRDQPVADHYEITLGRPLPRKTGGGYSVEGSFWFKVFRD